MIALTVSALEFGRNSHVVMIGGMNESPIPAPVMIGYKFLIVSGDEMLAHIHAPRTLMTPPTIRTAFTGTIFIKTIELHLSAIVHPRVAF